MFKREFMYPPGRYTFLEVIGYTQDENKNASRFLVELPDGDKAVMKPMYGHFGPSGEKIDDFDWIYP